MTMLMRDAMIEHYNAVRARLGAPPIGGVLAIDPPQPIILLDYRTELHFVEDPIPDQRRRAPKHVETLGVEAEIIALRRALAGYARRRCAVPVTNAVRHFQVSIADAFKIDISGLSVRCRAPGITRIRQIAMAFAPFCCGSSITQAAHRFGRDHSTAIYAARKFASLLDGATSQIGARR